MQKYIRIIPREGSPLEINIEKGVRYTFERNFTLGEYGITNIPDLDGTQNSILLTDPLKLPSLSRNHGTLRLDEDGKVYYTDTSTNGTLNISLEHTEWKRIYQSYTNLDIGDRLGFGGFVSQDPPILSDGGPFYTVVLIERV